MHEATLVFRINLTLSEPGSSQLLSSSRCPSVAMFTADEQRILDQLAGSGFDQRDVADLKSSPIKQILAHSKLFGRKFGLSIAAPGLTLLPQQPVNRPARASPPTLHFQAAQECSIQT